MVESKFSFLASYPKVSTLDANLPESVVELDLRTACIRAGNFEAFLLMQSKTLVNDGSLYMAAMLALPKFVQWLLANGHEPMHRDEETGPLIPLALVCISQPTPSCKIANRELDWATRQKQTMRLLAPRTNLDWKYGNKTVLHFAFDGGHEVTMSMVEALNLPNDPTKDDRYLYVDKSGIHYSPDQYVRRVLKVDERQRETLLHILRLCGLESRYFKDVRPFKGKQPVGYCGLPSRLQPYWDNYEQGLPQAQTPIMANMGGSSWDISSDD